MCGWSLHLCIHVLHFSGLSHHVYKNNILWARTLLALTQYGISFLSVPFKVLLNRVMGVIVVQQYRCRAPLLACGSRSRAATALHVSGDRCCMSVLFWAAPSCHCWSPIQVSPGWQLSCPHTSSGCAILQPHPSIQPALTSDGFPWWSALKSSVGGEKKTQPVSVLSLLEKRCSLAFSDGLFWERCAARIALVAPRSHLGWCGFWRRWPPGGGTFSGYLLTLLCRLCWLLAFGCLLTGVSSLNGKQKLNPPPAGPKCWLECGSRWDLKKIFF